MSLISARRAPHGLRRRPRIFVVSLVLASAGGCGFVPKTQFNACETQSRILGEQNKAQLAEIANLKAHSRKLEDELLQAERELASFEQRTATDQKRLANFQIERERVQQELDGLVRGAKLTGIAPVRDDDVERLTKRFPMLRFDEATGAYKLDVDVLFDKAGSRITPESEKMLAEFAGLFAEPEARDLRVMVVGRAAGDAVKGGSVGSGAARGAAAAEHRLGAERALAVAEFLRKVGLAGDRIGVSGMTEAPAGSSSAAADAASRRVEIFVMGKRTPVVGWGDGGKTRF